MKALMTAEPENDFWGKTEKRNSTVNLLNDIFE